MRRTVIIVAGGKGLRMESEVPKQFLPLNGKPIIFHTLEKFTQALPDAVLVLVLPQAEIARWRVMAYDTPFQNIEIAAGGASRFESARSGLSLVNEGIVGIHDAVRPLVSTKTIQAAFETAEQKGSAIPVVELKDSLRKIEGDNSQSLNRSDYCLVQTPQCFDAKRLKKAYEQEFLPSFTDDASVFEAAGEQIHLTAGNVENLKITTPSDLRIAEVLLR